MAERDDDGKFHHTCGESFTYAGSYAKHALKCDGTKPARSGRISSALPQAVASGNLPTPARPRASQKTGGGLSRKKKRARKTTRRSRTGRSTSTHPSPTGRPEPQSNSEQRAEVLGELRRQRDLLTAAIAGLEALP